MSPTAPLHSPKSHPDVQNAAVPESLHAQSPLSLLGVPKIQLTHWMGLKTPSPFVNRGALRGLRGAYLFVHQQTPTTRPTRARRHLRPTRARRRERAAQVALQVSLPEIDGAIEPLIFSGRDGTSGRSIPMQEAAVEEQGRGGFWRLFREGQRMEIKCARCDFAIDFE